MKTQVKTHNDFNLHVREINALPKMGSTMAAYCFNEKDGKYYVKDYYHVKAIDLSKWTMRLVHTVNQTIKKGKFITWPDNNLLTVIFHDDIELEKISTKYVQIEATLSFK